ncbi:MAG: terpene cyclase/mutase family protein [Candidatus Magasanikbacteria bacterium]|nr:terpene cyclase/mutase family protein [Candidatus Magasanikbacteria bacterium]
MKREKISSLARVGNFILYAARIFGCALLLLSALPAYASEDVSSTPETSATSTISDAVPLSVVSSTPAVAYPSFGMHVRYGEAFVFEGMVTSTPHESVLDTLGNAHQVTTTSSVLTALIDADTLSDAFSIIKLDYYDAYKSFYLDCITVQTTTSTNACGNWNYVVNGIYPSVGMDSYALKGDEQVYVYFGMPWRMTASTSTFPVNTTTTLSTWRYHYNNTSTEWAADGGDTVDVSVPNPAPAGWWDTTMTTTTLTSDAGGNVDYAFSATGTYYAKITSPDFSKWSNPITLTVLDAPVAASSTATSTSQGDGNNTGVSGGGGGGTGGGSTAQQVSPAIIEEKIKSILDFFISRQNADGKVLDAGTTDWAIMSFAAHNQYASDITHTSSSLLQFIQNDTTLDTEANVCAAYARRVLALRAADIAADDTTVALRVAFLIARCGAGGDKNLPEINDDIFVALALRAAGVEGSDAVMKGLHDAILRAQDAATGVFIAWGSPAPDMTGAAINTLKALGASDSDNLVIAKAIQYLHSTQLVDGGWNAWDVTSDPITTAWVMMGINALGEGQQEWSTASGKSPWNVMTEKLNAKGYYESPWDSEGIDWFGTKHAVPALRGKSWPIILASKLQPAIQASQPVSVGGGGSNVNIGSGSANNSGTPLATASSTLASVPLFASSTLAILPMVFSASSTVPIEPNITSPPVLSNSSQSGTINLVQEAQPIFVTSAQATLPRRKNGNEITVPVNTSDAANQSNQGNQTGNALAALEDKNQQTDPFLPLKKRVAESAATGSAAVFAGTSILLILRLLLAAL